MQGQQNGEEVKVLLVEDHPTDARRVKLALGEARGAISVHQGLFTVTHVRRLAPALELLAQEQFAVVLLDLQLPDSEGLQTLLQVCSTAPNTPVVLLTDFDDEELALGAIAEGAQDCIVKEQLDGPLLRRIIRHAIGRKRTEIELLRHTRQVEAAHARIEQQAVELSARAEELDRINRELDDFTYIASHDLKEPLRGIRGYCEILWEDYHDKLDDEGRRRLDALVRMCDHLERLIHDLLAYCRVGKTSSVDTVIDLNNVVRQAIEDLCSLVDQRGASVRIVGRLPEVNGDATLVGMVLGNLISNGLKFNRSERSLVEIGCLAGDPPVIYVRDNGIGIAAEHHQEIFTIFRRLHSGRQYAGSGAGLTIVHKIVESHGGRIWLESEPGGGSTFFFTLAAGKKAPSPKTPGNPPHWMHRLNVNSTVKQPRI